MAKRRMFTCDVIDNDKFLDMSATARLLYYDLGMRADDDGFVSPKKVMRMTSATQDDLLALISRGFIIPFESGVIVITNWKMNNYIQKDRYTETIYKDEKARLSCDNNNSYVLDTPCIQDVSKMDTQVRLGQDSIYILSKDNRKSEISNSENKISQKKKEKPKVKQDTNYGNGEINDCIEYLTQKLGTALDGTQKENRQYCFNLLRKVKKEYPDANPVDNVKMLIDVAMQDRFHSRNTTGFKYLFYNMARISQSFKSEYGVGDKSDIDVIL